MRRRQMLRFSSGALLRSKDAGRHPLVQDHISNCTDVEIKRLMAATLAGRSKPMPETRQKGDLWLEARGGQSAALRGFRIVPGYLDRPAQNALLAALREVI